MSATPERRIHAVPDPVGPPAPAPWAEQIAGECIAAFCRTYETETLAAAIDSRNRPLYRARFDKMLRAAIDRKLTADIAETIRGIL